MRPDRGMTLLEVLVALMVLSLTGLLLQQGLHFGTRAWDQTGRAAQDRIARAETARTLRALIEQAEPAGPAAPGEGFGGAPNSLSFSYHGAARLTAGRSRLLRLYLSDERDELRLAIADPGGDEAEDIALLDDVASLAFRYLVFDAPTDGNVWAENWSNSLDLPMLVELTLAFADGAEPLTILAAPRKRYPVDCLVHGLRACLASEP